MKKRFLASICFTGLLCAGLLFAEPAHAQTPPPPPMKPQQMPIDGGLGLLAAAGGAYALKKLKDKKK